MRDVETHCAVASWLFALLPSLSLTPDMTVFNFLSAYVSPPAAHAAIAARPATVNASELKSEKTRMLFEY